MVLLCCCCAQRVGASGSRTRKAATATPAPMAIAEDMFDGVCWWGAEVGDDGGSGWFDAATDGMRSVVMVKAMMPLSEGDGARVVTCDGTFSAGFRGRDLPLFPAPLGREVWLCNLRYLGY